MMRQRCRPALRSPALRSPALRSPSWAPLLVLSLGHYGCAPAAREPPLPRTRVAPSTLPATGASERVAERASERASERVAERASETERTTWVASAGLRFPLPTRVGEAPPTVQVADDTLGVLRFRAAEVPAECAVFRTVVSLQSLLARTLRATTFPRPPELHVSSDMSASPDPVVFVQLRADLGPESRDAAASGRVAARRGAIAIVARWDAQSTVFCAVSQAVVSGEAELVLAKVVRGARRTEAIPDTRADRAGAIRYRDVRRLRIAGTDVGFEQRSVRVRPTANGDVYSVDTSYFTLLLGGGSHACRLCGYAGYAEQDVFDAQRQLERREGELWVGDVQSKRWTLARIEPQSPRYHVLVREGDHTREGELAPSLPWAHELLLAPVLRELARGSRTSFRYVGLGFGVARPIELRAVAPGLVAEVDGDDVDELRVNGDGLVTSELAHPVRTDLLGASGAAP